MQVDSRSFARWARTHGLHPVHRVRVGRSTITAWSLADLRRVHAPVVDTAPVCVLNCA